MRLFWFLFMSAHGSVFPFYGLYLRENLALSPTEVGLIGVVPPLVGMAAQPLVGQLADLSGRRAQLLSGLCFGMTLFGAALALPRSFAAMALVVAVQAVFSTAAGPTAVAVSLGVLAPDGVRRFGRMRLFGTVGFLCSAVALPFALDALQAWRGWSPEPGGPSEPGLGLCFAAFGGWACAARLAARRIPASAGLELRAARGDWRGLVASGSFVRLVALVFAGYVLIEGPMFLFPVYVRAQGGDLETVSRMWVLMTLLEVPLLAASGSIVRRIGARGLFAAGLLAAGLRWTVCGFSTDLSAIYAAQLLHGVAVVGLLGPAYYVEAAAPERLRSTGQSSVAFASSFGVVASISASGWLIEHLGTTTPYRIGGLGAIAVALLIPLLLPRTPSAQA